MSSSKSKTPKSPKTSPPLIFPPLQTHKTTIIALHGRGSTALKFAEPLLSHPVLLPSNPSSSSAKHTGDLTPSTKPATSNLPTFHSHFPNTKFIFPTAPLRRAKAFNRSKIHQWFDTWDITRPRECQEFQIPGLQETSVYLHGLLRDEINLVGAKNVVLMGLSQGCASSLIATLVWDGEPFGGVVGMCGYLPLRPSLEDGIGEEEEHQIGFETEDSDDCDLFERDDKVQAMTKLEKVVEVLRDLLVMDETTGGECAEPAIQSMPVFMGHGIDDDKVPLEESKLSASLLGDLQVCCERKYYEDLGHWYSTEMLRDVVSFLKCRVGWEDIM